MINLRFIVLQVAVINRTFTEGKHIGPIRDNQRKLVTSDKEKAIVLNNVFSVFTKE